MSIFLRCPISRIIRGVPVIVLLSLLCGTAAAEEKWKGIDENVIKKYAAEQGREAKEPLINTDQGDLLLFVFLLAGAAGGFAAGYYWKTLVSGRKEQPPAGPRGSS